MEQTLSLHLIPYLKQFYLCFYFTKVSQTSTKINSDSAKSKMISKGYEKDRDRRISATKCVRENWVFELASLRNNLAGRRAVKAINRNRAALLYVSLCR